MVFVGLDALGDDVLYLVALAVSNSPGMLNVYSKITRRTRSICFEKLFASAMIPVRITHSGHREAPPPSIRPLVRQLTFCWSDLKYEDFEWEIGFFPSLNAIKFLARHIPSIPWRAVKTCITHPNISSLSFLHCLPAVGVDDAFDAIIACNALTHFSCTPDPWRDVLYLFDRGDISSEHVPEAQSLMLLIPPMSRLARLLDLPFETAPLRQMAVHSWSALRELRLSGRYLSPEQIGDLPAMLSDLPKRLPSLRHLIILASPFTGFGRAPVLGRLSFRVHHPELQSLVLSYPDPDDAICSIQAPNLKYLSLRDWPRYYYPVHFPDALAVGMGYPILSSSDCLSILRRMSASTRLERLELVYEADDAEDDLLCHITSVYPNLWSIELHRYLREDITVAYERIAQRLATMKWLQRLRLNLDFPETTGPFCDSREAIDRWTTLFLQVGRKIMAILHEACPMLVAVEMLKHDFYEPVWAKFYPVREVSLYPGQHDLERDGEWPPQTALEGTRSMCV